MARNQFTLDLRRFAQLAGGNARAVIKKVVIDLGTEIVIKTPVGDPNEWASPAPAGYVGGRARGSWQYAKGAPASGDVDTIDPTEPQRGNPSANVSSRRVAVGALTGDPIDVHYITSNLPYMRRLEYEGWSRQAPDGMVRKSIAEFQAIVDQATRELP